MTMRTATVADEFDADDADPNNDTDGDAGNADEGIAGTDPQNGDTDGTAKVMLPKSVAM
ncbi:MAG: hypothetical protein R2856_26000 [Caldilineaceae bacterium]